MDHLNVRLIRKDQLSEDQRECIVSLHSIVFGTYLTDADFDTESSDYLHVIGLHEERVVTHATVHTRRLGLNDYPLLKAAYVEDVATLPRQRGKGYASAVMRKIASHIGAYDIGALATDDPGFYERLGWELWHGPLFARKDGGLIPTPDEHGVMILRLPRTPQLSTWEPLSIEWREGSVW